MCINIGVKRRAYGQFIHKGRRLETADMLDIDLDDTSNNNLSTFNFNSGEEELYKSHQLFNMKDY